MSVRKSRRPQASTVPNYSGATGDNFPIEDDVYAASDLGPVAPGTSAANIVGRTTADLLHESGIQKALSRVLQEIDPLEVFYIGTYLVLSAWGNSPHPVWPFPYFALSLLGYHLLGRPAAAGLMRKARGIGNPTAPPQQPVQRS